MTDNVRPFNGSVVRAKVHSVRLRSFGAYQRYTDVTFAYRGEFYGCRFDGWFECNIEAERLAFEERRKICVL